ncbi:fimbrial assembly protein PilN [Leeuwenhoekiella aestuarii]|uniref:PilN domain-containing protein n=1 Tax=Leeuwenhoekiella aestuarii TaxID=2249426 RepID=UPI000FFF39C8|nr:PilN domain-containing protein [Leeuwenhoekiella aestuarii]RXG11483.1 fimbrial assembly protein PilN [Leeuwenhoekiella aestuarii]
MSQFNRWLHKLKEGTTYYGLEVITDTETQTYQLVQAKVVGGELEPISFESLDNFEELFEKIPRGSQVFLNYNTTQVIKKETTVQTDLYKQVKQVFPNLKLEDFYYEAHKNTTSSEIAICRKEVIDRFIESLSTNKIYVTQWSLNGLLKKSLDKTITVSSIPLEEQFIAAFSGTFVLATGNRRTEFSYGERQIQKKQLFHQERIYKLGLPTAVGFLLVALIINFLFFNSYYSEIEELREVTTLNSTQKQLVLKLQEEVTKTEQLLKDVQKSSGSKTSYFIDQLVKDLPDEILLNELNYQPLSKTIKEDAAIELSEKRILISGQTRENRILSQWISKLERLPFVKKLEIADLEQLDKGLSGFTINLELNE